MNTSRRELLARSAALAAFVAAGCRAAPERRAANERARSTPPFRISLAQWSLHRALRERRLDPLDFPRVARREHEIDAVEYVSTFYKEKEGDDAHFAELRKRCADE